MSKRKQHLNQRLEELFSSEPAAEGVAPPGAESVPQPLSAAPADVSYLKTVIDQLPLPAYLKDREHTWVAVNSAFAQLIGHKPESLLGHSDKEQADDAWQLDDRVLDTGQPKETQESKGLPNGTTRTRRTRRIPLCDAGQEAHYVMGVVEDNVVSTPALTHSPAATNADETLFRDLFENTDALIQGVANDGAFIFTNRAWREALGYSEEELARLNLFDVIHPDSRPHCMALFRRIMEGEHVQQLEATFVAKDGRTIDVEGSTSCSFKDGRPIITRGVFHDVSRRKRLEQDLQRLLTIESKRALQLQTAAQVSNAASTILDIDELLPFVVNLIQERFGLYYVGLFLINAEGTQADLRAATGEAGRLLLEQRQHLHLDENSMIGWCITQRRARIALNAGEDAVRLSNPLLPDTRSEVALPLISRGAVLGAMTAQSREAAAFTDQDVAVLQSMADQVANAISNAHLFKETQRRVIEMSILNEISQVFAVSQSSDQLFQAIHAQVSRLFDTRNFYLATYDGSAEWTSAYHIEHGARQPKASYQLGSGFTSHILRTGRPILIHNEAESKAFHTQHGLTFVGDLAKSWMGVPLLVSGQPTGVMGIQSYEQENLYHEHDLILFSTIAAQAAIALQNTRLYEEARIRAEELAALNELSRTLATRLDMEQVLEEIHHGVARLLDATNFYVALHDVERHEVSFPIDTTQSEIDQHIETLPADEGMTGYIIRTRSSLLIKEDMAGWLSRAGLEPKGEIAQSWLGVPLLSSSQVLGVIALQSYTTERAYDERDQTILTAIASQAAIAIQNARLFEQIQKQASELAVFNEIIYEMSQSMELSRVLEVAYQHIQELIPLDAFVVALYNPVDHMVHYPLVYDGGQRYQPSSGPLRRDTMSGAVILTGQSMLVNRTRDEIQALVASDSVKALGDSHRVSASLLYYPLTYEQRIIGAISAQSYQLNAYTPRHLNLLARLANQLTVAIQNARLFEQTQQNARELAALNELARSISQQIEVVPMLEAIYQKLQNLLPVDVFLVGVYDEQSNTVTYPVLYDERQRFEVASGPLNPDSGTGRAIRSGKPELTLRTAEELAQVTSVDHAVGQTDKPSASLLYVPMQAGEKVIGALSVQSYQLNAYTDDHVRLISAVASQTAVALQNVRLYEETRQRNAEQATLNQIISSASQTLDLRILLDMVLKQTVEVFGFDGGLITMYNENRQKLERIVRTGLPGRIPDDPAEGLENSLCAYVFNSKQPLAIEDFREGAPIDVSSEIESGYLSYIGVPLEARGRMLGTWCGFRKFAGAFGVNTLDLLQVIGHQLGFAIENARLFEETRARARREQTLREITARVRGSVDPETIVRVAVQDLGQALKRTTFIRLGGAEQLGLSGLDGPDDAGNGPGSAPQGGK